MKMLLLLTDPVLCDIYQKRGEREGFEVEVAQSLLDAERKAVTMRPKFFMLEHEAINNPGEFMDRLRSLPSLAKTHVIAHAARSLTAERLAHLTQANILDIVLGLHHSPADIFKRLKSQFHYE